MLPVLLAWFTKMTLDSLRPHGESELIGWALGLTTLGVVTALLPHLSQYCAAELGRQVSRHTTSTLFTAVNGFIGLGRFEDPRFLDRLRLAGHGGGANPARAIAGILGASRALTTITGFLGSLMLLNLWMATLVLCAGATTLVAELASSRRRARMEWGIGPRERREMFYSGLLSSVEAAKEVRLFGVGPFLRGRMLVERQASDAARQAVERREVLVQSGLGVLSALVSGCGLVWAVRQAQAGVLSVGDVTVFIAAVAGTQAALASLATELGAAHQAVALFEHYVQIVRSAPDLPVPHKPVRLSPLREAVELRDVWFRYSPAHPWILRGVNLRIPYGTSLALAGANGSGKSTLIKLICRFYDPTRGAVMWDGTDIRNVDPADLRSRIGALFQDFMDYDLTAAENIALGDLDALHDRERLRTAARQAGVDRVLEGLPRGYDTLLSRTFVMEAEKNDPETGVVLSGGQSQRLALARALLRDRCDLMVLDEPSAGLDAQAEHEIHTSLREHRAARTSVLISHRLGAVREADVIAVLKDGKITERGEHEELIAMQGEYARMFRLQAAGYRTGAGTGRVGAEP
ncbi:ABC transporter ATP-binding protein [Streptomyces sp. NPDC047725]|uniref:ABC transporter ATP-binding protein n=1 Tax=Streptomyces sp. NPDC047725 TaxID=3365487 RepID=UPI003718D48C